MHWSGEYVDRLRLRGGEHVIETGTSISGIPHLGNASDVIRGDCIRKALVEVGLKAELIWVSDDSDPFRKVPAGMESLEKYLGFPVKDIPDPHGCHRNFVDYFAGPFVEDLTKFGVKPTVYSGTDLYRSGALLPEIKVAFEKRTEIRDILNQFREEPLKGDYIPWTPICGKCGKISTTKPTAVDGLKVTYECSSSEVSGGEVEGCGFVGVSDASNGMGKLPWRVEWAARWHHFKVTCEPFGKEHAAAGGSYDTSKLISERVFGWEPPMPVIYEFLTLNGAKISSSKGNVITLKDWLQIAEPEVLKYFMYKKLNKARDINLSMLPNLVDEYDEAERLYYKKQVGDLGLARMYELSQVGAPKYLNVPLTLCAVLNQTAQSSELDGKAKVMGYEGFDLERLKKRVTLAGEWVQKHGPEYLRFKLLGEEESKAQYNKLDGKQKEGLHLLVAEVAKNPRPEELHKRTYETARSIGLEPNSLFNAIYLVLIGKEKGPKAASFMLSLGTEYLKTRF
ncbi:MAG: lysine--tRNA ligase [Candidatus Altiarchaeota archaeon]